MKKNTPKPPLTDKEGNLFDLTKYLDKDHPYSQGLLPNIPKDLNNIPSLTREDFFEIALGRPLRDVDKAYLKAQDQCSKEGKQLVYLSHLSGRKS